MSTKYILIDRKANKYLEGLQKTIKLYKSNKMLHIAILYGIVVQNILIGGNYNGKRSKSFRRVGTWSTDI